MLVECQITHWPEIRSPKVDVEVGLEVPSWIFVLFKRICMWVEEYPQFGQGKSEGSWPC